MIRYLLPVLCLASSALAQPYVFDKPLGADPEAGVSDVKAALDALPEDIRAAFRRIVEMIGSYGLERMREPYVKHLQGPVWEMRMKGKDGIARAA